MLARAGNPREAEVPVSRTTVVRRTIDAPPELVFRTVSDIREFSKAVPDIVSVEFLSEGRSGVGTRFRETRRFGKREAATELEVTEYEPGRLIRLVSESGGTEWDSVFTVAGDGEGTRLELVMDARPRGFLARITGALMGGMIRRALEKDMDAVKAFCEAGGAEPDDGTDAEPDDGADDRAAGR